MNKRELYILLDQWDDDVELFMSIDDEGNAFRPLDSWSPAHVRINGKIKEVVVLWPSGESVELED